MRKSPLITALGGSAVALGLLGLGTATLATGGGSEVETASADSPNASTQMEAMQRDLDLTAEEAKERMKQEDRARDLDNELRSQLGEAFGGSVFDSGSNELTVSVTDKDAAEEVREAGAEPRVVTYGQDRLESIADRIGSQDVGLDDGIAGYGPDIDRDAVVITVLEGEKASAQQLVADAGVDSEAVEIEQTSQEPRLYADIVGGEPYQIDGTGRCSIGFPTTNGFVTAGHCGEEGTPVSSQDGSGSGTVTGSSFPGNDMGVVEADSGWEPTSTVTSDEGPVTVAGSEEAPEGASICRSGSTTGWHCGTVESKGQTVEYPQGTVEGLTQTDVCAEPGDSGGSWLADDQAQGVTSGGSGDCTTGGTTFFQPVNPILDEYGVELMTG
ncbi:S1 family peptidase [Haloactinospora alba]|uniref:S1 family peptidase n=1 Tax=Haloactinospora alba TaxID=405555 RepID=UPI001151330E|nr:trypsin-like serine protease [Haloactinospora alba]